MAKNIKLQHRDLLFSKTPLIWSLCPSENLSNNNAWICSKQNTETQIRSTKDNGQRQKAGELTYKDRAELAMQWFVKNNERPLVLDILFI